MKELMLYFDAPDKTGSGVLEPKKEKYDDDTGLLDELLDKDKGEEEGDYVPKDEDEDKEPEDEDKEEEDLLEDKDEDKEGEEDELLDTNVRAVDFKKIKEKYEDFSKTNEYRELRNAYYRESKLSELFPTIEDAREAAENNETFTKLNESVLKGESKLLLEAIREADPSGLKKFTSQFMAELSSFDSGLYDEAVRPIVKALARRINFEGKKILARKGNDNEDGQALVATARNIMQYAFEDADLVDKDENPEDPQVTAKRKELDEREQKFVQERYNEAYATVAQAVDRHLNKLILEGLDPSNRMNDFVKDSLLDKIKNEVGGQLTADGSHMGRMNSLWNRARREGCSRESLSRIVSAYLERARPVIVSTRNKYKSIALRGDRRRDANEDTDNTPVKVSSKGQSGGVSKKTNLKAIDPKKIDWKNTSENDIFEGRVTLKR